MFNFLHEWNPFYKGICLLLCSVVLSFTYFYLLNISVFIGALLVLILGSPKFLKGIKPMAMTFCLAIGLFFTGYLQGNGLDTALNLSTRVLAFVALGLLFSLTTDPYRFVKVLQKNGKIPRKFAYGVLCGFNMIPYIKLEYAQAKLALKVRGVRVTIFSLIPIFSALVNSVKWSEALSMAMESKGFSEDE